VKTFFALLFILFSSACIVIPTPEHRIQGRVPCDSEKTNFMVKETTSKEEVLLNLGEPDLVLEHEKIFVYRWEMVAGYVAAYGGTAPIQRTSFLIIEFDDKDRVSRHEVRGSVLSSRTPSVDSFKSPQQNTAAPPPRSSSDTPSIR
jgi:outer membrane protein assembly factor BamE (lipoprotein component of BamABCDE complex)